MTKNNNKNRKNNGVPQRNHKKFLLPASKLPVTEKMGDFRETAQWRIFRIMSEFVDGFQFLADFGPAVSIFGSARTTPNNVSYKEAQKLGNMLGKIGFTMITGGGPGIMEAGNKGAYEAGAVSVGLNIQLPMEQRVNDYVTKAIGFHYFFTRKVMLSFASRAYVFFPGGFGTLDEFLEIVTLIQTKKIPPIIVVCVGKSFWQPFVDWMKETMYEKMSAVDKEDLDIYKVVDTADEAFKIIKETLKKPAPLFGSNF